jgi:hypothetical protein
MENPYIYSDRAVAFLDVLGFKNKLIEFEDEAKDFQKNSLNHEIFDGDGYGLLEQVFFLSRQTNSSKRLMTQYLS